MGLLNIASSGGYADAVRGCQHFGIGAAFWWDKLETGKLQQLAVRISKLDRVHKATVDIASIPDAPLLQTPRHLGISGMRDGEGQMMQVAYTLRVGRRII